VSLPVYPPFRHPPALYRLARAFRRISLVVLVLILLFLGTALYSAVEVLRSGPSTGPFTAGFGPNDTVAVSGSLNFSNPGFYPISAFSVHLRVVNASHVYLGEGSFGPVDLPNGATQPITITFYLPVSSTGPGGSLLTEDQTLNVSVWGNATYAYLFPISISVETNKSWGAPFADLSIGVGTPVASGAGAVVPVTIQFQNHAKFAESGELNFALVPLGGPSCGGGSFDLAVPPGGQFDQTTNVPISSGCSPSGGSLEAVYVGNGGTIPLPPQRIP